MTQLVGARIAEVAASVLAAVSALPPLLLSLDDSVGCTLAEDVVASAPVPAYDLAVYGGYAARSADIARASFEHPVDLTVVETVSASSTLPSSVRAGVAVRLETGARLPIGADVVIPVDHTDGGLDTVAVFGVPAHGSGVRPAGCEIAGGSVVLSEGTTLGVVQLAVLAAMGLREVRCFPHPRVVIVTTGEYGPSGTATDGLSHALAAGVAEAGGIAYRVAAAQTDAHELLVTLEDHLIRADLMIVCGGSTLSSRGPQGLLPEVLHSLGTVSFSPVAARPLGFIGFGSIGVDSTPFFALPADPASALVAFEALVRPAISVLAARSGSALRVTAARLDRQVSSEPGVCDLVPVAISRPDMLTPVATPLIQIGGHPPLALLAQAHGLAIVPEDVATVTAGTKIDVMVFGGARS